MASCDKEPVPRKRIVAAGAEPNVNAAVILPPDTVKETFRNTCVVVYDELFAYETNGLPIVNSNSGAFGFCNTTSPSATLFTLFKLSIVALAVTTYEAPAVDLIIVSKSVVSNRSVNTELLANATVNGLST